MESKQGRRKVLRENWQKNKDTLIKRKTVNKKEKSKEPTKINKIVMIETIV